MPILEPLYIALPAFVANMLPVLATKINLLPNLGPVHPALFGENKTWRGLVVGITGACVVSSAQWYFAAPHLTGAVFAINFGLLAGFGALGGDLVKSYFKRLFGIESGRPFIPFDQIDYILGFLALTYLFYGWSLPEATIIIVFALIANPMINGISYACGIKKTFW